MKCYNCKNVIPDDAMFCPVCGAQREITSSLLNAAIAGDQGALADLYNRTNDAVYHTIRFMVKDEDAVLDIMQDSYIKAFDSLGQLQEAGRFEPWIKRIAHNKAIDHLRKTKTIAFSSMVPEDSDEVLEIEDDRIENLPDVVIDRQETTRLINEILDSLPADQRAVISMFYYDQLSVKEIASELDVPEATVKSRLQYGRRKIETQVRDLEKKGTKLYSLAPIPFFMLLLREASAIGAPSNLLSGILAGGAGQAGVAGTVGAKTAGAVAQGVVKTAAAQGVKTAILSKIIAGIAIVTVIGGGTTAAVIHHNQKVQKEQAAANTASAETRQEEEEQYQETSESAPTQQPMDDPKKEDSPEEPKAPEEPEDPKSASEEPAPCLHQILERYATYLEMDPQEYLRLGMTDEMDNINFDMLNEYFRSGQTVYAGWVDINQDASKELIVALGDDAYKQAWAAYATDGNRAYSLSPIGPLEYRVNLYVLHDGRLMVHESGSAASGRDTICEIAEDRNGVFILERYEYDETKYGDMGHYGEGGSLTDEEFNDQYWNHAVEAAQLPDIEFFVLKEGQEPVQQPETAETEETVQPTEGPWLESYQEILDGYQQCVSEGVNGTSPYLAYERFRHVFEKVDAYTLETQYALRDVNFDGQLELVMAVYMDYDNGSHYWDPFEIYAFDGTKAVPLFQGNLMTDDDHALTIWAGGGLAFNSLQDGQTFYGLPAGTTELKLLDDYLMQFDVKVDQDLDYHSIQTPITAVWDDMQAKSFSPEIVAYIKAQLGIPADLETEDHIDFNNTSYWDVSEKWLVSCEFYHDGKLIAGALVDQDTGELVRNIMMYSGE